MRGRRRHRSLTAAAAVLAAAAVVSAAPVGAVQTSTYKLAATGPRTKIVHGYGNGAIHDTFVVADLSNQPITLVLDVVSATLQGGDYALGQSGEQFAAQVRIPQRLVTLKPHEQRTLTVVIDRPSHTSQPLYAAITAQPESSPSGGIGVQTRLALLVEVSATPERASGTSTATSIARVVAVIVAAGLVVSLLVLLARRRRRAQDPPSET